MILRRSAKVWTRCWPPLRGRQAKHQTALPPPRRRCRAWNSERLNCRPLQMASRPSNWFDLAQRSSESIHSASELSASRQAEPWPAALPCGRNRHSDPTLSASFTAACRALSRRRLRPLSWQPQPTIRCQMACRICLRGGAHQAPRRRCTSMRRVSTDLAPLSRDFPSTTGLMCFMHGLNNRASHPTARIMPNCMRLGGFVAAWLLVVQPAWAEPTASTAKTTDLAKRCSALTQESATALGEPTARILTATLNARSEAHIDPAAPPWMGPIAAMPEHCEVIGVMRERTGADGQHYVVKYHLRLPTDWNGRFLFQGGGGTNGVLGRANGALQPGTPTALEQGFAVVSTDTGHDNSANSDAAKQGTVAFGHDYEARLEYAEKALDSVATTAKRIVRMYYERPASHSFFAGCSNGGREGMVFAQRFPEQFDGIVAGSPAFAVPKAAIAEAWDTQTFAALAAGEGFKQSNGLPDIAKSFSDADLGLVAEAVAKACDATDGVVDGTIQNVTQCTVARVRPQLDAKTCTGPKNAGCLNREQVDALVRSLGGPHDSKGRARYAEWPWDVGIASPG